MLLGRQHATEYGSGWRGEDNPFGREIGCGFTPGHYWCRFQWLIRCLGGENCGEQTEIKKNVEDTYTGGRQQLLEILFDMNLTLGKVHSRYASA
jgi:hypothetical protein